MQTNSQLKKIKWNVLFHYLSLFIVVATAAAAVWGDCVYQNELLLHLPLNSIWIRNNWSGPLGFTIISLLLLYWPTKVIINRKNVAWTCTVTMMMMISSAIMWMLHILSLSSHQRQQNGSKWKKIGTKEHDVSYNRFTNPIKMIDSMGVWLTIGFYIYILNGELTTLTVKQWQSIHNEWQFPFVIFDDIAVHFCANLQNEKDVNNDVLYAVCTAIHKWKKLNVNSLFYPIMTTAVNERWRANDACVGANLALPKNDRIESIC